MLIDLYDLRHSLAAMVAGAMTSREDRERLAADVLRILDAFEAMERNFDHDEKTGWYLDRSTHNGKWYVGDGNGSRVAEGYDTALAALLAAAEGKSDG